MLLLNFTKNGEFLEELRWAKEEIEIKQKQLTSRITENPYDLANLVSKQSVSLSRNKSKTLYTVKTLEQLKTYNDKKFKLQNERN